MGVIGWLAAADFQRTTISWDRNTEIGKLLFGIYLGRSGTFSSLGAAGALIALLIWIYYSAQIFLFGAAFTRVHAEGDKAMVDRSSQAVSAAAQEEQRQPVRRRELESVDRR
ncbi:MAG: YihY/virulence factor BrkB family protein [Alphaproteobacteria bacterium]|nr:YihY/virulence factor BrkB family protein [Alphaproteobacteria bacterium]